MVRKDHDDAWDFTSVIDLIHSLSSKAEPCAASDTSWGFSSEEPTTPENHQEDCTGQSDLGNFDKLWKYLGQPLDAPSQVFDSDPHHGLKGTANPDVELADAFLELNASKGVRWRDEVEGADLADNDENHDPGSLPKLSKARKKKLRQKKKAEADKARTGSASTLALTSSENESERDNHEIARGRSRGSVIREILHGGRPDSQKTDVDTTPTPKAIGQDQETPKWPIANPRYFLHSSTRKSETATQSLNTSLSVSALRKSKLIAKLLEDCIEERPYLENIGLVPGSVTASLPTDAGVHVFVDASNIMIGFHDSLKIARGLAVSTRIRRQPLSFHNLSFVLERGRPAAKRVLVGSDNFPAIQEAKTIGYETNILDRVHKAKELTPRQKRFSNANGAASSGSETTAAMYAPEKWVEQAVDEILHLKILESVVDATEASTIVLATGDAAEAEYSQGFLKMVERAMAKGWKVELCSFRKNISGAYRKKDFRNRWGNQFKIFEMDNFVEELLGVE